MPFLDDNDLASIGFASIGVDVRVSDGARFYGAERIALGDHCRIDDFALLSAGTGGIAVGRHVHIACYVSLQGDETIWLGDYSGLSSRVTVLSSNDDYSGASMTGPTLPPEFRRLDSRPVYVGAHTIVGAGSIILPGVRLEEGAAVAALSLVKDDVPPFTVVGGTPARQIGVRKRDLLELERRLVE